MTDHLYYHDSFLYEFDANVAELRSEPRPAVVLDRTAFYPTSGGQVFDTGWLKNGIWTYFGSFYGHAWLWLGDGAKAALAAYRFLKKIPA